jgi:hypothetical protein
MVVPAGSGRSAVQTRQVSGTAATPRYGDSRIYSHYRNILSGIIYPCVNV